MTLHVGAVSKYIPIHILIYTYVILICLRWSLTQTNIKLVRWSDGSMALHVGAVSKVYAYVYIYIRTLVSDRFKRKVGTVVRRFDDFARGGGEYIYTHIFTSLYTFLTLVSGSPLT